ncbi:MAG TPA: cache and HAMP domain-containing protein [Lachnospiraceae bacterium]|nr:cache and HAMP domain-containing protein [Lachnospiraceae bacterium]
MKEKNVNKGKITNIQKGKQPKLHRKKEFIRDKGSKGIETKVTEGSKIKMLHKLMLAFSVPIILMIVLSILSYNKASDSVMSKYEESIYSTVRAMTQYFNLMCSNIESRATEQLGNESLTQYYGKYFRKSTTESMPYYRVASTSVQTMKASTNYISDFYVFAENGNPITSSTGIIPKEAYSEFMRADGSILRDSKVKLAWLGDHKYLDGILDTKQDSYGIYLAKKFMKGNGLLVIDIKRNSITDLFDSMNLGKESITALVTQDGKEIVSTSKDSDKAIFYGQDYYGKALEKGESGSEYITYQGEKYLFTYAPVEASKMMICTLIPKATILGEVSSIRTSSISLVLIAALIVGTIGILFASSISKVLNGITRSLKKVSEGDFTVDVSTKRKDEFSLLTRSINTTLKNIRGSHARGERIW